MPQWPGDQPLRVTSATDVERGDEYTSSRVSLGWHTGTHMDAPGHFVRGRATRPLRSNLPAAAHRER